MTQSSQPEAQGEPKRRLYRYVRYIREEYEIEASSRAEALAKVEDPHTVIVTSEKCYPVPLEPDHDH